ncbi:DUF5615 family PIN-like protein [Sulfuriferula plumbiphila]|uniref:DUF5615 family PIN-like protein n=1 Tax=Sulfuriferula plumbiphila TaxID=171865 RepID=UPI0018E0A0B6
MAARPGQHVLDVDLLKASDSKIWDYVLADSAVIITQDEDFAGICQQKRTCHRLGQDRQKARPGTRLRYQAPLYLDIRGCV